MARRMVWPALCGELEKRFGELKPGEQLPAEQSLADELQVSKSTLRRALDVFVEQGILAKQPGKGNVLLRHRRATVGGAGGRGGRSADPAERESGIFTEDDSVEIADNRVELTMINATERRQRKGWKQ